MDKRPIGIFDSGLGGITTVREVKRLMPNEDIIYFGDTARVPYGSRGKETIKKYASQDIAFLLSKEVKMIIAACGTVSANPPQETIDQLQIPYTSVLLPAAQAACAATNTGRIGIIATQATIKSGAYGKAIRNIIHNPVIIGKACPLFVPLIENGYVKPDDPVTRMIAEEYLSALKKEQIDTLILGCTHYPIIKEMIAQIMGDQVTLIDSGTEAAKSAQVLLTNNHLLNTQQEPGKCNFYISDNLEGFAQNAGVFLQDDIAGDVEKVDIDSLSQLSDGK